MEITCGYIIPDKEGFVILQGGYREMKDNKWIRDMDENTLKYILGLQEINKSLIKTLEIYGQLLRKVKSENENHGEIEKAIENIENVIASANKLHFLHEITLH